VDDRRLQREVDRLGSTGGAEACGQGTGASDPKNRKGRESSRVADALTLVFSSVLAGTVLARLRLEAEGGPAR
jgi:hypothetical protein